VARAPSKKAYPRSLERGGESDRDRSPVLGGSLTRSADGQLQTLQTHGMYPTPLTVQDVWTNASRKRYPEAWEGEPLAAVGYTIEWNPRDIACSNCGRSLGSYVGYRIRYPDGHLDREQGIVEDTSRRYERDISVTHGAGSRGPRQRPRFWLDGEIARRASKTAGLFRCPGCKKEYRRNLSRLGSQFFEGREGETFLLE
jgi:hypothetical protein